MAGLPVNTVMHGSPYNSDHLISPVLLADLLREIQTLAGVNGTIVDIRDTLAGLTAVGLAEGEYGMVVSAADEAGVYEMSGGSLVRRAAVPAVFLESTASVQALAARDETETLRDAAVAASTAAVQARDQSISAAQVAGAPIYPDTTAGLAGVAEGETFLVPDQSGLLVYVKTGGAADPQGRLGELCFDTVADFLAYDGAAVPVGTYARTRDRVGVYKRVADGTGHVPIGSPDWEVMPSNRGYHVDAFGASNSGADTTSEVLAAWSVALDNDTSIIYGHGTYLHTSAISADLRVGGAASLRRYVKLIGAGSAVTALQFDGDGINFIGAADAGVNNGDHRILVEGLSIEQSGGVDRTSGTAISASDMSGLQVRDVYITGFLQSIDLQDVLVAQFSKVKLQYAGLGLKARIADYSRINLSSFRDCSFVACWDGFVDIDGANIKFDTCGFEGLGLDTSGDKGDYLSRGIAFSGSPDGYASLDVDNCYFENNKCESDVHINATWSGSYKFRATNFNRAGSTRYSVTNVTLASSAVGTEQHAEFVGCGFLSVGTYTPSAARPKVSVQNSGGFNNWFVRADRQNVGLFSGVDAFDINSTAINRAYRVPRTKKGQYTPVIEGDTSTAGVGTYTAQSGIYERIGDMVFFSARVGVSAHTGSGTFKISLPPIAPDTSFSPPEQPVAMVYSGPAYTAGQIFTGYVRPSLSTTVGSGCVQLLRMAPAGTLSAVTVANASYDIWVSGSYRAAP